MAKKLEEIAFKNNPESIIDVRDIKTSNDISHTVMKEQTDSRILWHFTRNSGTLSKEANAVLLKRFLIDRLMCNYSVGNNSFALSSDNNIASTDIKEPLRYPADFISSNGTPYTAMSYYYYSSNSCLGDSANNVYRKIFEKYIESDNKNDIIATEAFEEMQGLALAISQIPDEEYISMFEALFECESDETKKAQMKSIICARKACIIEDTNSFIRRINEQRELTHKIEVIQDSNTIAIINDIHGNVAALETILDICEKTGKKDIFILGDMIGFGAQSNECIELIRNRMDKLNIRCILGNHELYALMGNDSFVLSQKDSSLTTDIRRSLSNSNREFLEGLPISRKVKIFWMCTWYLHNIHPARRKKY